LRISSARSAATGRISKPSKAAAFDELIFLKNGFSLWKNLVPFSIAALLLLVLSLPDDNLLLKLQAVPEHPSLVWIPAALVTCIALGVYVRVMYMEVRKAYLCAGGVVRRCLATALLFVILCALMAFGVLYSSGVRPPICRCLRQSFDTTLSRTLGWMRRSLPAPDFWAGIYLSTIIRTYG